MNLGYVCNTIKRLSNKTLRIQAIYSIKHRRLKLAKAYWILDLLIVQGCQAAIDVSFNRLLVHDDILISITNP